MSDDASMTAVVAYRYGPPDVLRIEQVPVPVPAAGEVLVRAMAIGLNVTDAQLRAGGATAWFDDGPWIWGWDVAGEAVGVGAGSALTVGDRVLAMPRFPGLASAYAQYVTAPESLLVNQVALRVVGPRGPRTRGAPARRRPRP